MGGVSLTAQYINETFLQCVVDSGQVCNVCNWYPILNDDITQTLYHYPSLNLTFVSTLFFSCLFLLELVVLVRLSQ